MKKILGKSLLVVGVIALGITFGSVFAQGGFGAAGGTNGIEGLAGSSETGNSFALLAVVKGFINWILGLLSLLALGMSLYGGFKMVTSAGDDTAYKEGFKVLKNAAIGLIVVGFSWIIVSSIFWLISAGGSNNLSSAQ